MRMPNFLLIGAAKCGTTALYEYLKQHPEIYFSPAKEPRFFALDGQPLNFGGPGHERANRVSINDLATYQALFDGVRAEKAFGEASPLYISHPRAPERIQHYVPDMKMIAILRDPVERAYSGYLMHVANGTETLPFEEAIEDEPRRIRENWPGGYYVKTGLYAEQLQRYYDRFDREQLRVYLNEDLQERTEEMLNDIFGFLGVDEAFCPDVSIRHNPSGLPKSKLVHAIIGKRYTKRRTLKNRIKPYLPDSLVRTVTRLRDRNLYKPSLDPEKRAWLLPRFRDDILRLQEMIDRDLSHWLS
jgi:hypothetical protein